MDYSGRRDYNLQQKSMTKKVFRFLQDDGCDKRTLAYCCRVRTQINDTFPSLPASEQSTLYGTANQLR